MKAEVATRWASTRATLLGRALDGSRLGAWIAGSSAVLLALTVVIGLSLLRSGEGWSAWTVESRADGSATVRIRDFRDAAGLERRLSEAGVPAYVTFAPEGNRCAEGTGPSGVDDTAVSVDYAEDAVVVHLGRLVDGSRLALAAFVLAGGGVTVEAAVVPVGRPRCALQTL